MHACMVLTMISNYKICTHVYIIITLLIKNPHTACYHCNHNKLILLLAVILLLLIQSLLMEVYIHIFN